MNNIEDKIVVATLDNNIDGNEYHLTSVYIALGTEYKLNDVNNISEHEYISFLSYKIENPKEITFFLDPKKFKTIFQINVHDIGDEFVFDKKPVFTVHINDQTKADDEGYFSVYYVATLNVDKLIKHQNQNNFGLELSRKNGDDDIIFTKSKQSFRSYQFYHKKDK